MCELVLGNAADIPFSDNEFDVVTLTGGLQGSANPQKALAEAVRVSRNRVFVGFLNRYSSPEPDTPCGIFSVFLPHQIYVFFPSEKCRP